MSIGRVGFAMYKLPNCPKCGEDELYLWSIDPCVRCYLCGWDSELIHVLDGETPYQAIVRVIHEAKERQ